MYSSLIPWTRKANHALQATRWGSINASNKHRRSNNWTLPATLQLYKQRDGVPSATFLVITYLRQATNTPATLQASRRGSISNVLSNHYLRQATNTPATLQATRWGSIGNNLRLFFITKGLLARGIILSRMHLFSFRFANLETGSHFACNWTLPITLQATRWMLLSLLLRTKKWKSDPPKFAGIEASDLLGFVFFL